MALGEATHVRRPRGNVGNRFYQAPEVVSQHTYTIQADIFSLGVVAFKLLYDRRPFETAEGVDGPEADFPSAERTGISLPFVSWTRNALKRKPTDRFRIS